MQPPASLSGCAGMADMAVILLLNKPCGLNAFLVFLMPCCLVLPFGLDYSPTLRDKLSHGL